MSDPTPQRPEILRDTSENTPPFQRPSTWYGLGQLALEASALATAVTLIPIDNQFRGLLITAACLKFLASVCGQVSTWFVRAGVTNLDSKVETVAARTEEKLSQ